MADSLPRSVRIVEVGPRDGLQNEAANISTQDKLALIQGLIDAGLKDIEATAFVHPTIVPQLADAVAVANALPKDGDVSFSALVPNEKGLERAAATGIKRIAVFTAASETFTQKNIQMTIEQSLQTFSRVVAAACKSGMSARGYVSTAFVCPYEGKVDKQRVREVTEELLAIGVDEVAISDTIGAAAPTDILDTVGDLIQHLPADKIALHLHDTYGTALANVYAGLQLGVTTFDASVGGLGGCPFAPEAAGNVATEDLVYMLNKMGIETGVNLQRLIATAQDICKLLRIRPHSRLRQSML